MVRQKLPNKDCEGDQSDAAHGGAGRIGSGGMASAIFSTQTFLFFALALVLFHHGRTGGENCGKGEKQPAKAWPGFLGDDSSSGGHEASENETEHILPPLCSFQVGCAEGDHKNVVRLACPSCISNDRQPFSDHPVITYHSPLATPNQKTKPKTVT